LYKKLNILTLILNIKFLFFYTFIDYFNNKNKLLKYNLSIMNILSKIRDLTLTLHIRMDTHLIDKLSFTS
jgi:hypothetical protein